MMIVSVLRAVDADLPVRLVPATRSKAARAEPIALRFGTGGPASPAISPSWKTSSAPSPGPAIRARAARTGRTPWCGR